MENRDDKTPDGGQQADISKSQAGQQPSDQNRQPESGAQGQGFGQTQQGGEAYQPETGEGGQSGQPGFGGPDQQSGHIGTSELGDTTTQQRSDIEGTSAQSPEKGEAESGFIGTEGASDTSSELVEDYAKDGQGAPEGK